MVLRRFTRLLAWLSRAPDSPFRDRPSLVALVPLGAALFAVMVWAPWYSNFDVDTLTHFEQIRSVADHGTIGFENGPVERYPELRTRWFVGAHGRLWGILPATMPYLLALPLRLGGYRGAVRAIWAIFALGALMTYALTWRLTQGQPKGRAVAVTSAYALVTATSLGFWGTMTAPFIPAASLGVTGVYFASRSFAQQSLSRSVAFAALGGLFTSLSLGCHLLWALPFAAVGSVLFAFGGLRERLLRAFGYGLAALPSLSLMSWVNHQRFNTWNPVSYGPCTSHSCEASANDQTTSAFVALLIPVLPYVICWAALMWLSRRSPRATGLLGFMGAAAALLPDTPLRQRFTALIRTAWGFAVDIGNLDMGFNHAPVGPGSFDDAWCVRSLLECSPFLAAALLASARSEASREPDEAHRAALWMLGGVGTGVLLTCALRADTGGAMVYGWPFLTLRYVTPMLPALVVLSASALSALPWRPWHALITLLVALGGGIWLSWAETDEGLLRRQLIHWMPLAMALSVGALTAAFHGARGRYAWLSGHAAAVAVALSLGWSAAQVAGIDRVVARIHRGRQTDRTIELARCTPHRFILLGGYAMDESLALHDHRDIYFINVGMGPRDGSGARTLVDQAIGPDRPAFLIQDDARGPWHFHWSGFEFKPIGGCPRVFQIVRSY